MAAATVRLGTRGSALALWQANWVARELMDRGVPVELRRIETTGDVRSGPIGQLAVQGVFTKEIQRALLDGEVDLAVHSLKDLPTEPVEGLQLACVPARAPNGDALLSSARRRFAELPPGATVATGSLRRRAQVLAARPDLQLVDVRGNVDTRIQKLKAGEFDALVLAEAGLLRLNLQHEIVEIFAKDLMLPAVGQGALGLETRADDHETIGRIQPLNDLATLQAVLAERALLAHLRGGCLAPVGAWGRFDGQQLQLDAVVLSVDGRKRLHTQVNGSGDDAQLLGLQAAEQLISQGATDLIAASRGGAPKR